MSLALTKYVQAAKPRSRRKIVRRVMLVCDHPVIGVSVFDRSVFKRAEFLEEILKAKDECRRKEPIRRRAQLVLEHLFSQTYNCSEYLGEFGCGCFRPGISLQYSVFWFDLSNEFFYDQQPAKRYIPLTAHHHHAAVRGLITQTKFAAALPV